MSRVLRWWVLVVVAVVVVAGPLLPTLPEPTQAAAEPLQAPAFAHPLGTDQFGRDVLSRTLYATRSALATAALSTLIAGTLGLLLGALPLLAGNPVDWAAARLLEVWLAVPGLLLTLVLVALLSEDPLTVGAAVGVGLVPLVARYVRTLAQSLLTADFMQYLHTLGVGRGWLALEHLLLNVAAPLSAYLGTVLAWALGTVTALDFLGVTGSPSVPALGRMINDARVYVPTAPWMAAPAVSLAVVVLAIVIAGGQRTQKTPPTS